MGDQVESLLHQVELGDVLSYDVEQVSCLLECLHAITGVVESRPIHLDRLLRVDWLDQGSDSKGESHSLWVYCREDGDGIAEQGVCSAEHGLDFIANQGVVQAAFFGVLAPLGYLIGEKLAAKTLSVSISRPLYYATSAAIICLCWAIGAVAVVAWS